MSDPLLNTEPITFFVLLVKYFTAKWIPLSSLPGAFKSLGLDAPIETTTASYSLSNSLYFTSTPTLTQVLKIIKSSLRREKL